MSSSKGESVYDRLYRTNTASYSSRRMAEAISAPVKTNKTSKPKSNVSSPRVNNKAPTSPSGGGGSRLDRLCRPTASSRSKTSITSSSTAVSSTSGGVRSPTSSLRSSPGKRNGAVTSNGNGTPTSPPSVKEAKQLFGKEPSPEKIVEKSNGGNNVKSTSTNNNGDTNKVPNEDDEKGSKTGMEWKLTLPSPPFSSSEDGAAKFTSENLQLTDVLQDFELGLTDKKEVALKIIDGLFQRDFVPVGDDDPNKNWTIAEGSVVALDNDENRYEVEKKATGRKEGEGEEADASVLSAKGIITFLNVLHEIRLDDYSFTKTE